MHIFNSFEVHHNYYFDLTCLLFDFAVMTYNVDPKNIHATPDHPNFEGLDRAREAMVADEETLGGEHGNPRTEVVPNPDTNLAPKGMISILTTYNPSNSKSQPPCF